MSESMDQFGDMVVRRLRKCGVSNKKADAIVRDIRSRAEDFAALDQKSQRALAAPFVENVFDFDPQDAPAVVKAAGAVIVRNGSLETVHAAGLVDDSNLRVITAAAIGPLTGFLAEPRNGLSDKNMFADLADRYPRAWAALTALSNAQAWGHVNHEAPQAPVPDWPDTREVFRAKRARHDSNISVVSAIDTGWDGQLVDAMKMTVGRRLPFAVPTLSNVSRNMDRLLNVLELLLGRGVDVVTTNYLIRPNAVWVRQGALVRPDVDRFAADDWERRGLVDDHLDIVNGILA